MARPEVPNEVLRAVRQRCGFGCVICGLPLYEYDHMLGWAAVQRHAAEEMTLLCRQHHDEKTRGLLPLETVQKANCDPYNRRVGVSKNVFLHYSGRAVSVHIGESVFAYQGLPEHACFVPLWIDGLPIIAFRVEDKQLLLTFIAFDECNKQVLQIADNELVYDTAQWDVEWVGKTLTVREGRRRILLQLVFLPPSEIVVTKGRILCNGIELLIGRGYLFCSNNRNLFARVSTLNVGIGIALGEPKPPAQCAFLNSRIPRYSIDGLHARRDLRRCLADKRRQS